MTLKQILHGYKLICQSQTRTGTVYLAHKPRTQFYQIISESSGAFVIEHRIGYKEADGLYSEKVKNGTVY